MYKRFLSTGLVLISLLAGSLWLLPTQASAVTSGGLPLAQDEKCPKDWVHPTDYNGGKDTKVCCPPDTGSSSTKCYMAKYINPVIRFLSALVGVVVLISVILGGIQYASAAGDSNKVAAAKQRIINSLGALVAFVFLFAFLQWIVPGGLL